MNGQRFILRGLPTITTLPSTVTAVLEDPNSHLCGLDEDVSSDNSIDDFHHCFIRPEPSESNAELAQREEEINEKIRLRKLKRKQTKEALPDKPRSLQLNDKEPVNLFTPPTSYRSRPIRRHRQSMRAKTYATLRAYRGVGRH